MRDLTIIVTDVSSERFRTALDLALAHVALGGSARVFLNAEAVGLVREPIEGWEDDSYSAFGLPDLQTLYKEALAGDVKIILCQSAMQMANAAPQDFDQRVEIGGMVSLLRTLGDGRLVIV